MPGGVLPYQDKYIDDELKHFMGNFDLRVGTLECAIGTNIAPAPEKMKENGGNNNVCYARDEDFFRVMEMGFDLISLGNNHSFDLGENGLKNTIHHLKQNGIAYFGAGMNLAEASAPAVAELRGTKYCFLGCCLKGLAPFNVIAATEKSYGVYQPTIEELVAQIKFLNGEYNNIIIMPHWGEEHVLLPPYKCVEYAKRMIDAGADAVFGSHSHRVSTNISYKGKPIYFGLGNFLYPDSCLQQPRPFYYPKSAEELKTMPSCINYPRSVSQNTLLVWSEDSRVGIAAEVFFENCGIKVHRRLVRMGNDNVLRLLERESKRRNFYINRIVLPFANFTTFPAIYRITKRLTWRVARMGLRNLGDHRKDV